MLPKAHNLNGDQPAGEVPLGSGMAPLSGLGVMYLTSKKGLSRD